MTIIGGTLRLPMSRGGGFRGHCDDEQSRQSRGTRTANGLRGRTNQEKRCENSKLGREVQARLGQQLRAIYDDVVNQGVPDRFADLLKQLDNKDNKDRS